MKQAMRLSLSGIVLGAGLYIILVGGYPEGTAQWAFGIVGFVVGYWFNERKESA